MKIVLKEPLKRYVLIDKHSGEFYCGAGYTHSEVMYAKSWDYLSSAKCTLTRYINDTKKGFYSHYSDRCVIPMNLEIKVLVLKEYDLL